MTRLLLSLITGIAAVAAGAGFTGGASRVDAAETSLSGSASLTRYGPMPGLEGAVTWLNSRPLTPAALRGKVVLVDFWTYSCINCIRTIPYIRAWADKYHGNGLVVLGVHTPEFQFERDLTNVNAAMERFKIDFPVAVDSDHRIWQAFGNRFWPAIYLVDANGQIRYRQYGEGNYAGTERAVQALLSEAGNEKFDTALVEPPAPAEQMAPDQGRARSEETYLGYTQATNFRSPGGMTRNTERTYTVGRLSLNDWGYIGTWTVMADRGVAGQAGSGIAYQFDARDLHLVLGPGNGGKPVRIQVTIDGRPPGDDHGADIDANGNGVVTQTRLYQLVRQSAGARERRFEIRFLDFGAEAYAFTFG